ncbi:MAG: hypothetical protein FD135_1549 [Comamonadaceae bacterium]|nr:MAG: hypothetical protein FD135_1549 [Comamonadaceae bacterium]
MPGGVDDLVEFFGLQRIPMTAPQQVSQPEDGVQRGAYLVAHVGHKGTLGCVCRLGRCFGFRQFACSGFDQFLQVVAVLIQFFGQALFSGDVLFHRHIVADVSIGLVDRRDRGELGVFAPVFAPVGELALPRPVVVQGIPHCVVGRAGCLARLQEARVLADGLLAAVAGYGDKGFVHVFDACIEIGDDDAVRALLDGQRKFSDLILGGLALGDVLDQAIVGQEFPRRVPAWNRRIADPTNLSVFADDAVFNRKTSIPGQNFSHLFMNQFAVFRHNHMNPEKGIGHKLFRCVSRYDHTGRALPGFHRTTVFDAHCVQVIRESFGNAFVALLACTHRCGALMHLPIQILVEQAEFGLGGLQLAVLVEHVFVHREQQVEYLLPAASNGMALTTVTHHFLASLLFSRPLDWGIQQGTDTLQQDGLDIGLDDVGIGTGIDRLNNVLRLRQHGEQDQWNIPHLFVILERVAELVAVHHRHVDVAHHQCGAVCHCQLQALFAVVRDSDCVARLGQCAAQHFSFDRAVFDDQNFQWCNSDSSLEFGFWI